MSELEVKDADDAVNQIKTALGDHLLDLARPLENRVYLKVESNVITDVTRILFDDIRARLQTASAVDAPGKIEILYHWALDTVGLVITVRTRIDREQAEIDSITPVCPSAHWIEREMWELMGVSFKGHPDLRHLVLTDDWPAGKYPLRRDYRRE